MLTIDEKGEFDNYNPKHFSGLHSQLYDYFRAMVFAEEEIMPQMTIDNLKNITPEKITDWIRNIHRFTAKTLLGVDKKSSGEYTQELVLRWHAGTQWQLKFGRIWFSIPPGKRLNDNKLHEILTNVGTNKAEEQIFIRLMEGLEKDKDINISTFYACIPHLEDTKLNDKARAFLAMFHKLAIVYNTNKLSELERKVVDKIVKTCVFPDQIPEAFNGFAIELLKRISSCDRSDAQILNLITWTYYTLTDIHPFSNGNGRTSIIFSNCILHMLGCPTILLRTNEQVNDQSSSYNIAVNHINEDLEHLKLHFATMLQHAREQTITPTKANIEVIIKRVQLALKAAYVLDGIKLHNIKSADAISHVRNSFAIEFYQFAQWGNELLGLTKKAVEVDDTKKADQEPLKMSKLIPAQRFIPPSAQTSSTSKPTQTDYIDKIKRLTDLPEADWKFSSKNKITIYAVVNKDIAYEIMKKLTEYSDAFNVRVCKHGESVEQKLLVFENINYKLLTELTVKTNFECK